MVVVLATFVGAAAAPGAHVEAGSGGRIVFMRAEHGTTRIYTVNGDGTGLRRMSRFGGRRIDHVEPSWSPDGRRIVCDHNGKRCDCDGCSWNGELYVIDTDGSRLRRLTHTKADDARPTWSPDGRRIAFSSGLAEAAAARFSSTRCRRAAGERARSFGPLKRRPNPSGAANHPLGP